VATSYFQTQKSSSRSKLDGKTSCLEFDYVLEYKPGKFNSMTDALNWKLELANMVSQSDCPWIDRINEGLKHDQTAHALFRYAQEGWYEDDLFYTKGRRFYVPFHGKLKKEVMHECHDSKWASHPGIHRTMAPVDDQYYWPHMRDNIEAYMRTCRVCQQDKIEQRSPTMLLELLPIPERS